MISKIKIKINCVYSKVKRLLEDIQSLEKQVFVENRIKEMDFNLPEELTREKYI